jgi:hypothetical protein
MVEALFFGLLYFWANRKKVTAGRARPPGGCPPPSATETAFMTVRRRRRFHGRRHRVGYSGLEVRLNIG